MEQLGKKSSRTTIFVSDRQLSCFNPLPVRSRLNSYRLQSSPILTDLSAIAGSKLSCNG
ncbi:MAG TPA: hypothetical protein V6D33_18940 [Cyanophyceae cyanobacterium]